MYLNQIQQHKLADLLAVLAEPLEEKEIRFRLGYLLLDLLRAQHYASYVWDQKTQRFDHGVSIGMSHDNLHQYEAYYQFNDPITLKLQQHKEPVRVTEILEQHKLLKTEFFNDFLYKDGLYWGVNLYAWSNGRNIGDIRIWRSKCGENFNETDMAILNLIKPAFTAALKRCQHNQSSLMMTTLPPAASNRLSQREKEVLELLTKGLADKEIARSLNISFTTVRTHIGHIFHKCNVENRGKLMCLMQGGSALK